MSMRTMSSALCRGALAVVLALALGRCAVLTAPPVPN
ncbi:putative membrane protein [Burkholderia ambifaria AMMD]|nr:putative membrane protein [Burkholderia ambifaria AMMD]